MNSVGFQSLLDSSNDLRVKLAVGCDDADVLGKLPTEREVERLATDIADLAPRLLHDDPAGGVIPDLILVRRPGWKPHVDRDITAGDRSILTLAIDAQRWGCHAKDRCDAHRTVVRGMGVLKRLAQGCPRRIPNFRDPDSLLGGGIEPTDGRPLAFQSNEQSASRPIAMTGLYGQVRPA